ncbi:uncharacterized protein LOC133330242 [Musca vetustissima]|uniref:uncharacterized protein LOC133330242 n=1 Tax=Musca vetustissima TaxID=27455 RepID=UPI002AB777FB|nr:uncharacterized protein LOC133330242 [Musca vetustissima]
MWFRSDNYTHSAFAIFTLVICLSITIVVSQQIVFTSGNAKFHHAYFKEFRLLAHNGSLDILMNITHDLPQDPWMNFAVSMGGSNKTAGHRKLLQYNVNMCKILDHNERSLVSIWVQNIFKHGTIPSKCPIKKGNYTWCGMRPEMLNIPTFFAKGQYFVNMDLYFRQKRPKISLANLTVIIEKK